MRDGHFGQETTRFGRYIDRAPWMALLSERGHVAPNLSVSCWLPTAEVLGCSVGTVKSQLHDARRRVAAGLREEGLPARVVGETGKEAMLG